MRAAFFLSSIFIRKRAIAPIAADNRVIQQRDAKYLARAGASSCQFHFLRYCKLTVRPFLRRFRKKRAKPCFKRWRKKQKQPNTPLERGANPHNFVRLFSAPAFREA